MQTQSKPLPSLKVFVYYNLHKHCWSVKALNGDMKGKVILHTHEVYLTEVEFRVQPAGRARVLREGKKNVHAGVVGLLSKGIGIKADPSVEYRYNPYHADQFQLVRHHHAGRGGTEICGNAIAPQAVLMKGRKVYHAEY